MPTTYTKIQTVRVGSGGSSSIQFTNIPQIYTDLKILISGRGTSTDTDFFVTFNGNSAANYNYVQMYGYVTGNSADRASSQTSLNVGVTSGASTSSASAFSANEINILNYALSTQNKAVGSLNVTENNGQVAYLNMKQGQWSNTSAITSLSLACSNGNWAEYTSATLYGVYNGIKATGGAITADANYFYHTFLSDGTFTPLQSLNVDYLVVAGGAGGVGCNSTAGAGGPGGGAGGVRSTVGATGGGGSLESQLAVTANTSYTVTVGAGGAGSSGTGTAANGANSIFSTITSIGGGGNISDVGQTGGSGGGGRVTGSPGSGTTGQGFAGSAAWNGAGYPAGAGGGASAVGGNTGSDTGGQGGAGITTSISGSSTVYGGGGGGGSTSAIAGYAGAGGSGGGGAGGAAANGTNGTANRGGGGGGAGRLLTSTQFTGGTGGSGIVIVRYAR